MSGLLRLLDELAHLAADAVQERREKLAAIREQFKKDQAAIAAK